MPVITRPDLFGPHRICLHFHSGGVDGPAGRAIVHNG
jgi:hypothetical protein